MRKPLPLSEPDKMRKPKLESVHLKNIGPLA